MCAVIQYVKKSAGIIGKLLLSWVRREWKIHAFSIPGLSSCSVLESNGKGDTVGPWPCCSATVSLQAVCFTGCRSPYAGQSTAKAVVQLKQGVLGTATPAHSVFNSTKWMLQPCYVTASLVCPRAPTRVKFSSGSFICHDYSQRVGTQGNCGQLLEGLILFFFLEDSVEYYWIWAPSCSDAVPVPFLYCPSEENQWWQGDKWGWCPNSGNACKGEMCIWGFICPGYSDVHLDSYFFIWFKLPKNW